MGGESLRLTVSAVASLLGVAPATLRTWDHRYNLGPSKHGGGAHRRYTAEDLARLQLMRALSIRGVAVAEAADQARSLSCAEVRDALEALTGQESAACVSDAAAVRGLIEAAQALDSPTCEALISGNIARIGVVATWERLIGPSLATIGTRWERGQEPVEVEHLLSQAVIRALSASSAAHAAQAGRAGVMAPGSTVGAARPVILAGAPDDPHDLPLHALAAALGERGIPHRLLGGRVPTVALHTVVRRTSPRAVFLWSSLPESAAQADPRRCAAGRPGTFVVLGGPGWSALSAADTPTDSTGARALFDDANDGRERWRQVSDLSEAVNVLVGIGVGAPAPTAPRR